jgi:hypothetical protein
MRDARRDKGQLCSRDNSYRHILSSLHSVALFKFYAIVSKRVRLCRAAKESY